MAIFSKRERDDLKSNQAHLWYWMLTTRAYWRLEEVFGYNMDDWAAGVRW
jgi:hypothetical protein